jgi:hypothetical protein
MIYVHFQGALGNQMFQYAFARRLSLDNGGEPIIMDAIGAVFPIFRGVWRDNKPNLIKTYETIKVGSIWKYPYVIRNCILFKGVEVKKGDALDLIRQLPLVWTKYVVFSKFVKSEYKEPYTELIEHMIRKGEYIFPDCFEYKYTSKAKNKHILSINQSEKYFYPYKDIIKQELKIATPPSPENQVMLDEIQSCNAVMVHFRLLAKRNGENESYYTRAMRYIAERVENPVFYIFSDKTEYIKNNMKFDYLVRYVDINNAPETFLTAAYEDLRLMYFCKHAITCVSTFSWWGAYLIDNPDKIVIMPDKFNDNFKTPREHMIYPEGVIKIPF